MIDEKGETIKIEKIRQMQSKILEKPIISDKKVYIINDANNMTKEAQNCLLKTLEEPPEFVVILLVASNENQLLNTVRSRCTKISFQALQDQELKKVLKEKFHIECNSEYLLKSAQGSIKRALYRNEKKELYEQVQDVFGNIKRYTILDVLNKLEVLYKSKEEIMEILDYIQYLFLEKAKDNAQYLDYIEKIESTKKNLKANSNFGMQIDELLFKIWEEKII